MKQYEKKFTTDPHTVEVHELAHKTPSYTESDYLALLESMRSLGQLQPVIMYRGKLCDGRHRLKAAKELGILIEYINLQSNLTIEEVEQMVVKGYESRRHQTPTQKAISAYKYYTEQNLQGNKLSMGQVAKEFGSNRNLVDRARQLSKLASEDVVTELWNGAKLKFGASKPTDSLLTAINYYKLLSDEILEKSSGTTTDLTDAELEYISELIDNLQQNHNGEFMKHLANTIHSKIQ